MHPLTPDLSKLSMEEVMAKHSDLLKKITMAYRWGNADLVNQLQMVMEDYQSELNERNRRLGNSAGRSITTGSGFVGVGADVGYLPGGTLANATTTGANQTLIGQQAGQGSATQRDDVVAIGYRALVDGNGAVAIGSGASAGAAGAVAIGRSSAGAAATTSTANDIALGVAAHRVTIAGTLNFAGTTATTVGAAGAASALPANPTGYVVVMIAGTQFKMPYYAM